MGEKPSDQMLVVENNENMNNILGQETNYRNIIYGIFYRLSYGTVVLSGGAPKSSKASTGIWAKVKHFLPLIVALPILVRTIFLISQFSKTSLLTLNWATTFPFVATSFHGVFSALILYSWNSSDFINEFAHKLHLFLKTREKQVDSKPYRCAHILSILFLIFYLYAFGYFCVDNFIFFEEHTTIANSTAFYRLSLTGTNKLWAIDTLIVLWGSFMSATLLIFYFLINHALIVETTQFNKELREAADNLQLQHPDLLNNYANRHLELVTIIKFANEKLSVVATPSLMAFIICHFSGMFVTRGFDADLKAHQLILIINLMLASLFALLIVIKKPAALHNQVHETKNIIILEKSIWKEAEIKLITVGNTIIDRILKADFSALLFDGFVICERVFHIVFFVFPIAVEVLVRWKHYMD